MKISSHSHAFFCVIALQLLVIVSFAIIRLFFCFRYASVDVFLDNEGSIPLFFLNSLRFDAQVGAYVSLPLLLMALLGCVWSKVLEVMQRFAHWYVPFAVVLVAAVGIADVHYYNNFGRHYDIVVFDFFDEDPAVLIKGIWDEAPVCWMIVSLAVISVLSFYLYRFIIGRCLFSSLKTAWSVGVGVVLIEAISIRGSLGVFTLRIEDTYVSSSITMNDCVPNGVFMLKNAWSEKKKQFVLPSEESLLSSAGFPSLADAICEWRGGSVDSTMSLDQALLAKTPDSVKCKGMNVVLLICESWGNKLIDYEGLYGIDLLGGMNQHFNEGLVWRRFVSAANGTIDAVESFVSSSPYERFFASKYRNLELESASARLFQHNGYATQFISGIEISWRNLINVLPHQGFDRVVGKFEILKDWPQASCNHTWGVYDHDMLKYVLRQLESPSDGNKPQFIMALTSTNHTPFEFPASEPVLSVPNDPAAFAVEDMSVVRDYLMGYRYTSRSLAQFLTALKKSSVGDRTIVAITGDHNTRLILPYSDQEEEFWRYSVPLYLYIPGLSADERKSLQDGVCAQCASHQDVLPTLANLTLPSAQFYQWGRNLLVEDSLAYGQNTMCLLMPADVSNERRIMIERRAKAHEVLRQIWFRRQFVN